MGPNTGILEKRLGPFARVAVAVVIGVLALGALAYATNRPKWEAKPIVAVSGATGQTTLEITVAHGGCPSGDPVLRIDESVDEVRIRAEQDVHGDCEDVGLETILQADLDQPLADRPLVIEPPARSTGTDCTITGRPGRACAS